MDVFYTATFAIAIVGSVISLFESTVKLFRKFRHVKQDFEDYIEEIKVLDRVLDESESIMKDAAEFPKSAEDAHNLCIKHSRILDKALCRARPPPLDKFDLLSKTRLIWREDQWKQAFQVYKDSVFLLRDLCAE